MGALIAIIAIVFGVGIFGFHHDTQKIASKNRKLTHEVCRLKVLQLRAANKVHQPHVRYQLDNMEIKNLKGD